ncbi:hypothetical protein [Marininema halotolerans]|uniref:hypothetical protein n=1 Tax=Marininema halotolerans TaxID=1155944 RepID=UPI001124CFE7|nr:hypothetical protein [Marininema halotolerans]
MSRFSVDVRKIILNLRQRRVACPDGGCNPFRESCGGEPCYCIFFFCMGPASIVSNADVAFFRNRAGGIGTVLKPSKFLQYILFTSTSEGKIIQTVFRFPNFRNENKRRAFIQTTRNGKLVNITVPFDRNGRPISPNNNANSSGCSCGK